MLYAMYGALQVTHNGLCHTDIHMRDDDWGESSRCWLVSVAIISVVSISAAAGKVPHQPSVSRQLSAEKSRLVPMQTTDAICTDEVEVYVCCVCTQHRHHHHMFHMCTCMRYVGLYMWRCISCLPTYLPTYLHAGISKFPFVPGRFMYA